MAIVYINYADKKFKRAQTFSAFAAKFFGKVDCVIKYSDADLEESFKKRHKSILCEKRGGGYWLWKPYIILKTLESVNDNDIVVYVDSGAYLVKSLLGICEEFNTLKQPILGFKIPLIERQWTKRETIVALDADESKYLDSSQVCGTFIFVKKNLESLMFIEEYLKLCCQRELITDDISNGKIINDECFIEHRHDQSIFSILFKKYNYTPLTDISDWGFFLEKIVQNPSYLYDPDCKINKYAGSVMLFRNGNPILHYLKYRIKRALKNVFPALYTRLFNKRMAMFNIE